MTLIDDDSTLDPAIDDLGEFDEATYRESSYTMLDSRLVESTSKITDDVKRSTADQFIVEAMTAAVHIRNILGDADGYAADCAETIRTNLFVLSEAIKKDPASLVISALLTIADPNERKVALEVAIAKLVEFSTLTT